MTVQKITEEWVVQYRPRPDCFWRDLGGHKPSSRDDAQNSTRALRAADGDGGFEYRAIERATTLEVIA